MGYTGHRIRRMMGYTRMVLHLVGIDSWMPLVVRHLLEKCFSNAKNVVY
jgi:hypothetical protein